MQTKSSLINSIVKLVLRCRMSARLTWVEEHCEMWEGAFYNYYLESCNFGTDSACAYSFWELFNPSSAPASGANTVLSHERPMKFSSTPCWSWEPPQRGLCLLTLKSPHCVSSTIIHSCVLGHLRAQLQGELVLVCDSGDGHVALERCAVTCASTIGHMPSPF
jgi:hypothetical protein